MITFLNFAPIEFMGGAEKWMLETAKLVNKKERTTLLYVDRSISDLYAELVLKRKFNSRVKSIKHSNLKITLFSFVPFTSSWKNIRGCLINSRVIYSKYELMELCILLYFIGFSNLKRVIFGLHTPFLYAEPDTFLEKFHNSVYSSIASKFILTRVKKIHVLNNRDREYLKNKLNVHNIEMVPNSALGYTTRAKKSKNVLKILFVGDVSKRKGIDILLLTARMCPKKFKFTVVGDGSLSKDVIKTEKKVKNISYLGYLTKSKLFELYKQSDILFLPSRAESMPLAILEAMSYGLIIVDSKNITLGLDRRIEYSSKSNSPHEYVKILKKLDKRSHAELISDKEYKEYLNRNFSKEVVNKKLIKLITN